MSSPRAILLLLVSCATSHAFRTSSVALSHTALARSGYLRMAGFGVNGKSKASAGSKGKKKGGAAKPAAAPLSPKKQWDRFKVHRHYGIEATTVYARVSGDEPWLNVGDITVNANCDVAGAVQLQKRLILEHAVKVHPQLLPKARELEAGFDTVEGIRMLSKTTPIDAADAGFVGRADASGRYGKTEAEINEKEPSSLRAATNTPSGGKMQGLDSKGRLE
mmetsp:Transcript_50800/g.132059  ORF Transcript_50800/g.132059 Transcript_50800/m.132059 type:complete len:220 (+) Transcript_50800:36-695(+)